MSQQGCIRWYTTLPSMSQRAALGGTPHYVACHRAALGGTPHYLACHTGLHWVVHHITDSMSQRAALAGTLHRIPLSGLSYMISLITDRSHMFPLACLGLGKHVIRGATTLSLCPLCANTAQKTPLMC